MNTENTGSSDLDSMDDSPTLPPSTGGEEASAAPEGNPGDSDRTVLEHQAHAPEEGSLTDTVIGVNPRDSVAAALRNSLGIKGDVTLPHGRTVEKEILGPSSTERYEECDEIARGGMGAILRLVDNDLRRLVAMKVMLPTPNPEHVERFVEEAQITGQLEHPNIVPVHELGLDAKNRLYFTMKLVKGRSLEDFLRPDEEDGELPRLSRLLEIFIKILDAMGFAHSRGVIHRDLKPENIMVGSFGEVLLMDWGLAKVRGRPDLMPKEQVETVRTERDSARTQHGAVMGTPAYMSPEQADGRHDELDDRSDVWSMGGILYNMLTGAVPYDGSTVYNVVAKAVRGEVIPPRTRAPDRQIPPELESICLRAMARLPESRYATASAMKDDILAYLDRRLVSAHRYGMATRMVRFMQRHPTSSLATGVAAVLLSVSAAVVGVVEGQREAAVLRADVQASERRLADERADAESVRRTAAESAAEIDRLRAEKAELKKQAAEQRAEDAESSLQKSRQVSGLLRSAFVEIGDVPRGLKRLVRERFLAKEIRDAQAARLRRRVLRFGETVPEDEASQAVWLSIQGWVEWNAHKLDKARALFREARSRDPDVVYGWLFEALGWFARYVGRERFTAYNYSGKGVEWHGKPKEHPDQTEAREHFQVLVQEVGQGKIWGQTSSREFLEALKGFTAYYGNDFKTAIPKISQALAIPEMAWIADELYFARAKIRLLGFDFDAALADLDRAISYDSMASRPHVYRAQTWQLKGYIDEHAERDPVPAWEEAVKRYEEAARRYPGMEVTDVPLGLLNLSLAISRAKKNQDPQANAERAIQYFTAGTVIPEGFSSEYNRSVAFAGRSDVHTFLVGVLINNGKDPGPALLSALEDMFQAMGWYYRFPITQAKFADSLVNYCRYLSRRGGSPGEFVDSILDGSWKPLQEPLSPFGAALGRAEILRVLYRYEDSAKAFDRAHRLYDRKVKQHFDKMAKEVLKKAELAGWKQSLLQAGRWIHLGAFRRGRTLSEKGLALLPAQDRAELTPKDKRFLAKACHNLAAMLCHASVGRSTLAEETLAVDPDEAKALRAKALDYLRMSLDLGADRERVEEDKDFDPLRELPGFQKLFSE